MRLPTDPVDAPAVVVLPSPGLVMDDARISAGAAGLQVVEADTLAAVSESGDRLVGGLIAPGVEGFASESLAADIAAAQVRIVAACSDDLPSAGIDPRNSALARAGARVIYGRGSETTRWAITHLRAWASNPPLTISYGDHPDQAGDLWTPPHRPGPSPVVVLLHGGFWRRPWERDLMDALAADLTRQGFAAWNLEYRRLGDGGGWPMTADDVAAGIDHLQDLAGTHRLDLERVVLLGHGAGAQLALWAAARRVPPGLRLVVGLAALCDLALAREEGTGDAAVEDFLATAPDPEAALADASPVNNVPLRIRVQLAHATDDGIVPVEQSRAYVTAVRVAADAAGDSPGIAFDRARLYDFNTGGHFGPLDPTWTSWKAVVNEMARATSFFPSRSLDPLDPLASRLDDLLIALAADPRFGGAWWDSIEGGQPCLVVAMVDAHSDEDNRLAFEHDLPAGRLFVRSARYSLARLRHYHEVVSEILDNRSDEATFRLARVSPIDLGVVLGSERVEWELVAEVLTTIPCDALQLCIGPEELVTAYLDAGEFRHPAIDAITPDPDPELQSRPWLRRRRFALRRWDLSGFDRSMDDDRVDVLVDGVQLGQMLQPFDSAWAGVPYALVAPPSRHWLGEPKEEWVGDRGVVVIDGSCGTWECCGVTAHIHFVDDAVYWAIDHDGGGWDGLWRWRRVAWLHFDRAEYEEALSALATMEIDSYLPPPGD